VLFLIKLWYCGLPSMLLSCCELCWLAYPALFMTACWKLFPFWATPMRPWSY
jgi:hypothetical protein